MMNGTRLKGLAAVLAAALLAGVGTGCTDWHKEYQKLEVQYAELMTTKNTLQSDYQALQGQFSRAQSEKNACETELTQKTQALTNANATIATLEDKLTAGGTTTVVQAGSELQRFTVGGDILFPAGRATLTPAGKTTLDAIAAELKATYADAIVRVYGYTDGDPIVKSKKLWQDNLDLSANRAMAVTRYLRSKGITDGRIETVAMGKTNPVAANTTKAGKAQNRRVVIVAVKR
jgi:outer membrane protein OmpA-like peptidoglycan-associated protein